MPKKISLFIILFAFLSFTLINNFRDLVLEKLQIYVGNYPEKIYVQTDKPYYAIGEDIWYTAYLVNGITHIKSEKSNVIYVELVNERDSIVSRKKLHTDDLSAAGDFKIDKNLKPGNYLLRAYTNYMRNSNTDYFFQKQIPIWNAISNDTLTNWKNNSPETSKIKEIQLTHKPDLGFYPESGYLIDGIATKIGIKIKDKNNRNITVKGYIKNSNHEIISSFETHEFGLSIISLLPQANKSYYASITIGDEEFKYPLPKAKQNGYILNAVNNGDHIILKASTNNAIGLKNTFLIAHQRGKLIFERLEKSDKNSYSVKLSTNNLSDGIANFTLFNNSGQPVCERLVFIENPNNKINVNIDLKNKIPTTRDKVSILLHLTDKNESLISGNISISITDIDAVEQSTKNENIKTYLLLNSDLRGQIKNPGYFFEKENDAKRRYLLDLLMLTHGWRRFTWTDVLYDSTKNKEQFQIEKGLYLSGQTQALKEKGKPISAATRLTFMGAIPHQELTQSDPNGRFNFGPFVFYDSIPTLIEARVKQFKSDFDKNRNVSIFLNNNTYHSPKVSRYNVLKQGVINETVFTNFIKQSHSISEIGAEYFKNAQRLDEILITANIKTEKEKREEELTDRTDYGGWPTHRLDLNDMPKALENQSIIDVLRNLPSIIISNDTVFFRGQVPRIILDGFPMESINDVLFLQGSDIEFIDLLSGATASYYNDSANGIIAIYTKLGNSSIKNIKRKPGIIDFYYPGFYTTREFYSPDYVNSFDNSNSSKQDIRTTLHWEPKVVITENSKTEVTFFTSDTRSRYAIKIEGITDTGLPVYYFSTFEVE